ncbi:MAG: ethylbenzene dehydrogenase-related protein, partial [Candidatus Zixiibacteriota bacterium]
VSTNPAFEADDGWWSYKINDSAGGRHFDNSPGGGYASNLNEEWDEPYFLPWRIEFENCIVTESDRYFPYRAGLDNFAQGATLPGMLVSKHSGDRGDIYARGQWRNGLWTVEISRLKNTGSTFDVTLRGESWLSLAVFNNAETEHAYHLKPLKFIVEQ